MFRTLLTEFSQSTKQKNLTLLLQVHGWFLKNQLLTDIFKKKKKPSISQLSGEFKKNNFLKPLTPVTCDKTEIRGFT